jgi:hypothetical protein
MRITHFQIIIVALAMLRCSGTTQHNHLTSNRFNNQKERVEALKKAIAPPSELDDAEFDLFNVNGFSGNRTMVPGASSWNYEFAVKVKSTDLDKWTKGLMKIEHVSYDLLLIR